MMGRLYALAPLCAAAGYLMWSASRLVHEIRSEIPR